MGAHPAGEFDPQTAKLIKWKVRRLIGRYGFTASDEEDLRQEIAMHVVNGMRRHDPARASARTYADRIVTSKIVSIVNAATAQKRDRRKERRLKGAADPALLDDETQTEQLELGLDVREAIATLPPDLRQVAILLTQLSEAEVIRETGYSREKVRGMQRNIARHFRNLGLGPNS